VPLKSETTTVSRPRKSRSISREDFDAAGELLLGDQDALDFLAPADRNRRFGF